MLPCVAGNGRPGQGQRIPVIDIMANQYELLRIAGADREAFLQGQLTQDVSRLQERPSLPAAWCSAKGRVVVTLQLIGLGDAVGLVLPAGSAESACRRLQMYRLRSKVDIDPVPGLDIAAYAEAAIEDALLAAGARPAAESLSVAAGAGLVCRRLGDGVIEVCGTSSAGESAGIDPASALDPVTWHRARILAGLVEIDVNTTKRFTPHMLNLDRVAAISFTKGCYTGQEVVARTENLGRVKRRINRYRLEGVEARIGDRLHAGDNDLGEIVNVAGDLCLALVPIDRHESTLSCGPGTARPLGLPYPLD